MREVPWNKRQINRAIFSTHIFLEQWNYYTFLFFPGMKLVFGEDIVLESVPNLKLLLQQNWLKAVCILCWQFMWRTLDTALHCRGNNIRVLEPSVAISRPFCRIFYRGRSSQSAFIGRLAVLGSTFESTFKPHLSLVFHLFIIIDYTLSRTNRSAPLTINCTGHGIS